MAEITIHPHDKMYRDLCVKQGDGKLIFMEDDYRHKLPTVPTIGQLRTLREIGAGQFTLVVADDGTVRFERKDG